MAERALATAFVNIVPGTKDFDTLLRAQLGGQMPNLGAEAGGKFNKGFGGVLGKIGGIMSAAFAVGAVAHFTKSLIDAGEQEVAGNKRLENITKQMGLFGAQSDAVAKRLEDLSTKQQLANGIDDDTIKLTMSKLMTFKELAKTADVAGGAFDRATQASIDMAAAGFGSAETNAVQLGKALQDPIKGITALSRSGITFTDQEKARIATLVHSNKIGEAQALVLKAIETQVGGTAAATVTGTARMKQGWENLKETIGLALMPAFDKFAGFMADTVFPMLTKGAEGLKTVFSKLGEGQTGIQSLLDGMTSKVTAWIQGGGISSMVMGFIQLREKIVTAIANALPAALNAIISALAQMLPQLVQTLVAMIPQMLQTAQALFTSIQTAFATVVPKLITSLAEMLPKIVTQITGMLPGLITSAINLFMGLVQGLLVALPKVLVALLDALPKIVQTLVSALPLIVNGAVQLFTGLINGLVKVLPQLINMLVTVVLPKLITTIVALIPILINAAVQLFLALVQGLTKALPVIIGAVVKLIPVIVRALLDMMPQIIDAGLQIIKGLAKGIWDNAPKIIGSIMKDVGNLVIDTFKNILGIHSPSKVFKEFGKNVLQGLVIGLEGKQETQTAITSNMKKVADWITDALASKQITKKAAKAARSLVSIYTAELTRLTAAHDEVVKQLTAAQDELQSKLDEKAQFVSSLQGALGASLNIQDGLTAKDAIAGLKSRVAKTKELASVTSQLKAMGLSDSLYKQIVEAQAVDFAKSIIEGGQEAVSQLNVLAAQADAQAVALANQVGAVLFDQGISFAQSVVNGLKAKEADLSATLDKVATEFATKIAALIQAALNNAKLPEVTPPSTVTKTQKNTPMPDPKRSPQSYAAWAALPKMAAGGFVTGPTTALIGESGPEVVTPLKDFERMMGMTGGGQTVNYYAAPNQSLDAEQALFQAIKRAKVVASW
jgi:hypothetical protein